MPAASRPAATPPQLRTPGYDVQVALTDNFLNRALALAFKTGKLPSTFTVTFGAAEDPLGLTTAVELDLSISNVVLFSQAGAGHAVGLKADWSGKVIIKVSLAQWTIDTPAGAYVDPALEETFTIPFSGGISATAEVQLRQLGDKCLLAISFARLDRLTLGEIGDLQPGADFTELVRSTLERIAVVALRKQVMFPALNALAGSLPAPAKEILGTQSAQIGATDFKVTVGTDASVPDEMQLLLQAKQNLGQQSYASVASLAESGGDVAISLSERFLSQMLQDLWVGGVIPVRFADTGEPDPSGPIWVERLSFAAFDSGDLQLRVSAQRKLIGLPVTVNATAKFEPVVRNGVLFAENLTISLDLEVGWAKLTASSALFFFLYEVIAQVLLRGIGDLLEPWADATLEKFLAGKGIDLRRRMDWEGTPFKLDLAPSFITIAASGITAGLGAGLHV